MYRRFILLTLAAASLAACGPRPSDPAKTIRVDVGDKFRISLQDRPGTGYDWHPVAFADGAPLVLVDSGYWMSAANRRADGGAGVKSWTFRALREGSATVSLVHVPPGMAPETVRDTTRFRVIVK
ncbi:MAG TPA: protease inhibitor I42 family protein [Longimicrobium sp.]